MQFKKIVAILSISLAIAISSPAVCAEKAIGKVALGAAQAGLSCAKLVASNISIPVPVFGGRVSLLQLGKAGLALKLTQTLWQMRHCNPAQRKSYLGTLTTLGLFGAGWWLLSCNTEQIIERINGLQDKLTALQNTMDTEFNAVKAAQEKHGLQLGSIAGGVARVEGQLAAQDQRLGDIAAGQADLKRQQGNMQQLAADHHAKAMDGIRGVGAQVDGLADQLKASDQAQQQSIQRATAANAAEHQATRAFSLAAFATIRDSLARVEQSNKLVAMLSMMQLMQGGQKLTHIASPH